MSSDMRSSRCNVERTRACAMVYTKSSGRDSYDFIFERVENMHAGKKKADEMYCDCANPAQ